MKSVIGVLLLGALCALAKEPEATVEIEPEFDLYGSCPAPGFNASSSHFTCGDHNCSEMEMLETILLSMNLFTPSDDLHPHYTRPHNCAPPPHTCRPTYCDSQNMILKVAGVLQSLSSLLSLCGSPQFCCPHSHCPTPMAHNYFHHANPAPNPANPNFGSTETHDFDLAIDDIVSVLMSSIQEEIGEATVESEAEVVVDEVEKELEKKEEEEKAEEKVTVSKGSEERDETSEPKKRRKKGSKKETEEKEAEEKTEPTPTVSLMDVLNMSR